LDETKRCMMNKTLLKQLIREEIKNVREQMSDDLENTTSNDDAYSKAFDSMDTDPTQAIEKMADRLGMRVNVDMGQGYNKLEFLQKEDVVNEKTFEQMITFLEKIGYNVDLGQSDRTYETEDDRRRFPRIIF
jgi:hypothetical protein